jgi:LPXTG-motif cell wall-anchored protein
MEALTTLCLVLVAIFIFKEKYNWLQIGGLSLMVLGVFLISKKKKD